MDHNNTPSRDWNFIGSSPGRCHALKLARQISAFDVPVLITGPSGVGKDVLANDIHHHSQRVGQPFIAINCSSIAPDIIDAELFGVAQGACTGAVKRDGLFQAADGGTLFLDEVGDLSLTAQTKLLRAVESGMIRPVGNSRERKVNVRIISATNKNLPALMQENKFRDDLFSRLSRFSIRIPSINSSDIRILLPVLSLTLAKRHNVTPLTSPEIEALTLLAQRFWVGNVRDLQSALERHYVMRDERNTLEENWRLALNETIPTSNKWGAPLEAEGFSWEGKTEIGKIGQAFSDLVFIDLCLHMAADDSKAWGLFRRIGSRIGMTGAGVTSRLDRLELVTKDEAKDQRVLEIDKMIAYSNSLRDFLAPYQALLNSNHHLPLPGLINSKP